MAAMASSRTFPLLFLLLSLIRGGASTLGYALLPQHLLAQHNHTSWNNHTRAPPQLNRTSFARCLSAAGAFSPSELPDLRLMRSAHDLKVDDGLLMYLSLYAGQRFPKIIHPLNNKDSDLRLILCIHVTEGRASGKKSRCNIFPMQILRRLREACAR